MHFNWSLYTSTQTPTCSRKTAKSKMLGFKCQQNRTINEEFDFFAGEGLPGGNMSKIFFLYGWKEKEEETRHP